MIDRKEGVLSALHRLKVETGSLVCCGCGYEHNCGVHGCAILRETEEVIRDLIAETVSLRRQIDALTDAQAVVVKEFDRKLEELAKVRAQKEAAVLALSLHRDCDDCAHYSSFDECPADAAVRCESCPVAGCPCRDCVDGSKWMFGVSTKEA